MRPLKSWSLAALMVVGAASVPVMAAPSPATSPITANWQAHLNFHGQKSRALYHLVQKGTQVTGWAQLQPGGYKHQINGNYMHGLLVFNYNPGIPRETFTLTGTLDSTGSLTGTVTFTHLVRGGTQYMTGTWTARRLHCAPDCAPAVTPQGAISGTWRATMNVNSNTFMATYRFRRNGAKVSGTATIDGRPAQPLQGTYRKGVLVFSFVPGIPRERYTLTGTLHSRSMLAGDVLFAHTIAGGTQVFTGTWSATRS